MSSNAGLSSQKIDRRILRTREVLGDALVNLILQKPLDSITVQDVLDRAGVSRSTFYVHYRDKNDLLLSDADEFFQGMATALSRRGESSDRVAPVRELFAHLEHARPFHAALVAAGRIRDVMDLAHGHFARGIDQRLAELPRAAGVSPERRRALSQAFAGALLSMLSWWINRGMPESPDEIDDLYHGMVWSGVQAAVGPTEKTPGDTAPPDPEGAARQFSR